MKHEAMGGLSTDQTVGLAEIVGAFSYALDITEGQPAGHAVRCCWIGSHIGRAIGLSAQERDDLYYALLLRDLGCSSNAARICELYQADDRAFKQGYKTVGTGLAATIHFIASRTAQAAPLHRRASAIGHILKSAAIYSDARFCHSLSMFASLRPLHFPFESVARRSPPRGAPESGTFVTFGKPV